MFGCLKCDIFETASRKLSSSCNDNAALSIFLTAIIYINRTEVDYLTIATEVSKTCKEKQPNQNTKGRTLTVMMALFLAYFKSIFSVL
jgi:hypothetical protein